MYLYRCDLPLNAGWSMHSSCYLLWGAFNGRANAAVALQLCYCVSNILEYGKGADQAHLAGEEKEDEELCTVGRHESAPVTLTCNQGYMLQVMLRPYCAGCVICHITHSTCPSLLSSSVGVSSCQMCMTQAGAADDLQHWSITGGKDGPRKHCGSGRKVCTGFKAQGLGLCSLDLLRAGPGRRLRSCSVVSV